jgi:hypothetical protein
LAGVSYEKGFHSIAGWGKHIWTFWKGVMDLLDKQLNMPLLSMTCYFLCSCILMSSGNFCNQINHQVAVIWSLYSSAQIYISYFHGHVHIPMFIFAQPAYAGVFWFSITGHWRTKDDTMLT